MNKDWEEIIMRYLSQLEAVGKESLCQAQAKSSNKKESNTRGRPGKIDKDEPIAMKKADKSNKEIAEHFGVSVSAVSKAWQRINTPKTNS